MGRSLWPEFDVLADITHRLNKQGANLLRPACFPGSLSEAATRNIECGVGRHGRYCDHQTLERKVEDGVDRRNDGKRYRRAPGLRRTRAARPCLGL